MLHCSIPMGTDFEVMGSELEVALWHKGRGKLGLDMNRVIVKRIQ